MKINGLEISGIDSVVIDHKFVWIRHTESSTWTLHIDNSQHINLKTAKTYEQMAEYVRALATRGHMWIHNDTINVVTKDVKRAK